MFVRKSKFKHIIGKSNRKEACYENIRITKNSWDSTFCSVNPKYLAIITEVAGGGAFLVIPIEKYGRVERDAPLVAGHKAAILDIQWCPHNDDLIASASEDCTAKVWQIPDGGLQPETNLTTPIADLSAHQRRVGLVRWHPTAEYILLTAGTDNMVFIWNISTEEKLMEMTFPDIILSASFSYNGSKLVTTCKDRKTRIINPRTGELLKENICHQGTKPQQAVYLKDGRILTTGFSRRSERQVVLWGKDDVTTSLTINDLDSSNGVLFPFYDPDCSLIFLCGKGDCSIRYFEVTNEEPFLHYIDTLTSTDPQRGMGWMPKRGLNVAQNEIERFFKLHVKGLCEVISFTVPRKSALYQEDLYPETASDRPALTANEWLAGRNADPILMSLKDAFQCKERTQKRISKLPLAQTKVPNSALGDSGPLIEVKSQRPPATISTGHGSEKTPCTILPSPTVNLLQAGQNANPTDVRQMLDDMRKMKIIIKGHERRIKQLEDCFRVDENGTANPGLGI